MGGGGSSLATSDSGGVSGLGDVPENCVAMVLMHMDPPEICRLARVNKSFHRASQSDCVWKNKLPCNYGFLMERVFGEKLDVRGGLKEIFSRLCLHNRFDNGTKEMWLDQNGGKVFLVISAKAMKITGIYDRRYWKYISTDKSRFGYVFYLQQTWWLEVVGDLEFHFLTGTYSLFFKTLLGEPSRRFGRTRYTLDQVHGWDIKPVRFHLSTSDGQFASSEWYLKESGKWITYHVGDFVVENPNSPTRLKFSMLQIDCTHTKAGLCLDSVIIRPSFRSAFAFGCVCK